MEIKRIDVQHLTKKLLQPRVVCFIFLTFFQIPFWKVFFKTYPLQFSNLTFVMSAIVSLFGIFYFLFKFFDFPYVYKFFLTICFLTASISGYFMLTLGQIVSKNTFLNLLETNKNEANELMTTSFFVSFIFLGLLPSLIVWKTKIIHSTFKDKLKKIIGIVSIVVLSVSMEGRQFSDFFKSHKEIRQYINPIQPIYAFGVFVKEKLKSSPNGLRVLTVLPQKKMNSTKVSKSKLVVFVLGETARSENFSLNGYAKLTNPLLGKIPQLVSFKNAKSCGTETAISVPCLFSFFGREKFDLKQAQHTENLLDVLLKAGVRVLWRDNDSGCKGLCARVETHDFNQGKDPRFCGDSGCYDEVLLNDLDTYISKEKKDTFIVLHMKGNHGPSYFRRFPHEFKKFLPQCESDNLSSCTQDEIINSYDNALVYTDYVLNKVLKMIETNENDFETHFFYVSDHGESLGENGIYLHAIPYWMAPIQQIKIPFLYKSKKTEVLSQKKKNEIENKMISHDNVFHSIIGLFKINLSEYDDSKDFFKTFF